MRVLPDTNVIVSAVTTRGLCADVFRAVLSDHDLVTCRKVLDEVRQILRSKFSAPAELVSEYIELLSHDTLIAEPEGTPVISIRDREDVEIVAAAIAAGVQVLVTDDAELHRLRLVQGVKILSPRAFWEELKVRQGDVPGGR